MPHQGCGSGSDVSSSIIAKTLPLKVALARVFPPLPAESVIPLAGIGAATGEFTLLGVAVAGGLGSLAGQLVWFLPSRLMGRDRLEAFASFHGPDFHRLPRNTGRVTLRRENWTVPASYAFAPGESLVPLGAGEPLAWRLA